MRLTIELTPQQGAALSAAAGRKGVEYSELARQIVTIHLPELEAQIPPPQTIQRPASGPDAENLAAIALLQSWMVQDATDDPEEIRRADDEFDELRRNLNANRAATGERPVFP